MAELDLVQYRGHIIDVRSALEPLLSLETKVHYH